VVFAIAALGLGFIAYRHRTEETRVVKFSVPAPEKAPFFSGPNVAVSPDGRHLAFVTLAGGKALIWVRDLDSLAARPLPGTEGESGDPFWSPDSRSIAFFAGGKLKKIDVTGGPAAVLADGPGAVGGNWGKNDVIVFPPDSASVLFRVSATGGSATPVTTLDKTMSESSHRWPWLLPDGHHFLYTAYTSDPQKTTVYLGDLDSKDDLKTRRRVLLANSNAAYAPPGYLLFMREQTLMAQPFDAGKAVTTGDPVPIAEQVEYLSGTSNGTFSLSQNGVLAYLSAAAENHVQLTWFDRQGKNLGTVGEPGNFSTLALSKDGKQGAVSRQDSQSASRANLWLYDFTRGGASTRFTFDNSSDAYPVFSPDGSRIVFTSNRDGPRNLYQKPTSSAKNEEPLLKSEDMKYPFGWSPDGRFLLYVVPPGKTKGVWILPMEGSQKQPMLFQRTEFIEAGAQFSPDGRWIAYYSNESGSYEVYVREFSLASDGKPEPTAKHQISTGGGVYPHWRDDGKELIYVSLDRRTVMSAEVVTNPVFQVSASKALFQLPAGAGTPAVTGDGKRLLVAVPVLQSGPQQFTVVLNWPAGLKK
jgi:Tol biopolymer transport system component